MAEGMAFAPRSHADIVAGLDPAHPVDATSISRPHDRVLIRGKAYKVLHAMHPPFDRTPMVSHVFHSNHHCRKDWGGTGVFTCDVGFPPTADSRQLRMLP